MRRQTLADRLMAEKVNYGGELIARGTLALRMTRQGHDPRAVDYFAFGRPAVPEAEHEEFGVTCTCGARWQSGQMGWEPLATCPICEEHGDA